MTPANMELDLEAILAEAEEPPSPYYRCKFCDGEQMVCPANGHGGGPQLAANELVFTAHEAVFLCPACCDCHRSSGGCGAVSVGPGQVCRLALDRSVGRSRTGLSVGPGQVCRDGTVCSRVVCSSHLSLICHRPVRQQTADLHRRRVETDPPGETRPTERSPVETAL